MRAVALLVLGAITMQACRDAPTGDRPQPAEIPAIAALSTGDHSCALDTRGAAYCWGYNANGQLGNNDTSLVNTNPVRVLGGLTFRSIDVPTFAEVSCGITTAGAAYCWGKNDVNQIGDGTKTRRLVPTAVAGGIEFKSISVGFQHVCAVATTGTAYCWGFSANGAFGDLVVGSRPAPELSAPQLTLDSVVSGDDFSCGLTTTGAAYCWGVGNRGQLGNGDTVRHTSPVPVAGGGGLTFRSLVAAGRSACGLTPAGRAYCWGYNFYGQLGDGTNAQRLSPVAVAGGLTFDNLSAGYETVCGVTPNGAGYCWGYNAAGSIGDGSHAHRSSPTPVAGGLSFRGISAGTGVTCGIGVDSVVYCWGDNSDGELGDGTTSPHVTPAPIRWR